MFIKSGLSAFTFFAIMLLIFSVGTASAFEPGEWSGDIQYLQENLPRLHKNLFFNISGEEFTAKLSALQDEVENLEDLEVVLGLMEVFSAVGDSHTGINFQPFIDSYYPLFFNRFGEDFYLTGVLKGREDLLGSRLVSINHFTVEEIIEKLDRLITAENRMDLLLQVRGYLNLAEVLRYAGITGERNEYVLETEEGLISCFPEERDISQLARDQQNLSMVEYEPNKYLKGGGQLFWYEYYEENSLLYFQYNACWGRELEEEYRGNVNNELPSFEETTAELIDILKNKRPGKFVIDLRYNSGGSSLQGTEFAEEVGALELETDFYVLTGERTFSSAIINAIDFINYCGAVVVGEPTRGRPNHYGEVKSLTLPNTGLPVSYSTKYFQIYDKDTDSLYPDITVYQTYEDFLNGIDTVMKKVEEL